MRYIHCHCASLLKPITFQELTKREVVNVTHLVIPAELGALLHSAGGEEMSVCAICGEHTTYYL